MGPKCIKNCWPFVLCLRLCIEKKKERTINKCTNVFIIIIISSFHSKLYIRIRNQREQRNKKSFCHSSDSHVQSIVESVYLPLAHMPHQPPHMVIFIAYALLLYVGMKKKKKTKIPWIVLRLCAMNAMNVKCVSSLKHINKLPHILFRELTTKTKYV